MSPAVRYTHSFVCAALPEGAERVLEVGCGDGALAALLQSEGLSVVAIDSDEDSIAAAKSLGVDARVASWPDFQDGRFDAVLFTRSLHHIDDLDASISAAFDALQPSGRVIVEDFDAAYAHEPTLVWLSGIASLVAATGVTMEPGSFVSELLTGKKRPLDVWRDPSDDHHLHSAEEIEVALGAAGTLVSVGPSAYFFRYVADALPEREEVIVAVQRHEMEMIDLGRIEPLGRRFVAEPKPS